MPRRTRPTRVNSESILLGFEGHSTGESGDFIDLPSRELMTVGGLHSASVTSYTPTTPVRSHVILWRFPIYLYLNSEIDCPCGISPVIT